VDKINFSPDNIKKLFQDAIDETIEQHRIKGESITISEHGKVKIIPPGKITLLANKLTKRKF
jgi:hypothetical protein